MMQRSDTLGALTTALAKAQQTMAGALKDSVNPHFKSKYADLASVWDACRDALTKNGLAVLQPVSADGPQVTVTTLLTHTSGEWISESLTLTAVQNTPQAVGSAITYGRRYGLAAMVGIAPEDDDANAASQKGNGYTVDAPSVSVAPAARPVVPSRPNRGGDGLYITNVKPGFGKAKGFLVMSDMAVGTNDGLPIYDEKLKALAEQLCQDGDAVTLETRISKTSLKPYVTKIARAPIVSIPDWGESEPPPISDKEIPF